MNENQNPLRHLPAVERVLNLPDVLPHCSRFGRATVTEWIRKILTELRNNGNGELPTSREDAEFQVVHQLDEIASQRAEQRLQRVINGTGVVIHTNLGRAPLAPAAIQAMNEAAICTNLELDLTSGQRGRRGVAVERLCGELTGAEAALIVNNCAAATLLTLQTLGAGREVVISRGQLIEIGGSFRLPDVFRQAGVALHEVGTTNRTRLSDYENAIGPETAALLRVHPSNYRVTGFCESVSIDELTKLARSRQIPVIDDVGSGSLYDLSSLGLPDEPEISKSIHAGADLVLFSGDKLLGGPQCGIIVGRAPLIDQLRRNPLSRALRVDKLTFAALQATLEIHQAGRAFEEIPVLKQLALTPDDIRHRAERLVSHLREQCTSAELFSVQAVESASGGGSLAGITLPSWAVALSPTNPATFAERLRLGTPAVMSRLHQGRILVDLRTVLVEDEDPLCQRILDCLR
ncbi:MAG: L-seryl-tRNA(Sec) selenium transferase [Planctomycetaceae bacterium]|nr:L-seryl-tRNA(Sec) selenium transferase [Planctomycetaceae bacterium]